MDTIHLKDMNWPDIQAAVKQGYTTVVFGIGSTEQHGPHLPLKTDAALADEMVFRVASRLGNTLIAPTIRVGCSEHHLAFAGSISLKSSTLEAVLKDYVHSLQKHGFKTIILIPTHGGNFSTVQKVVQILQKKYADRYIIGITDLFGFIEPAYKIAEEADLTREEAGAHAGESETSMMMVIHSHLVKKERFEPGYIGPTGQKEVELILEKGMTALTANGILGNPENANPERGEKYLQGIVDYFISEIKNQIKSN
ncbi:MAG: creatininase family protein [bacterium]